MPEAADVQTLVREGRIVEAIKASLQRDGVVPMPSGHGAWLFIASCRQRSNDLQAKVRSDVLGTLLGDAAGRREQAQATRGGRVEQWMRVRWVTYAGMWFEVQRVEHGVDFRLETLAKRWRYLLQASEELAKALSVESGGRLRADESALSFDRARQQIAEQQSEAASRARKAGEGELIHPAPLLPASGGSEVKRDSRWDEVVRRLQHPTSTQATITCLLYFWHQLHAMLGIEQASLDESYYNRRVPYEAIADLLSNLPVRGDCRLATLAAAMSKVLRRTALLNRSVREATLRIGDLTDRLPACFGPTQADPSLPDPELVEVWAGPAAASTLHQAQELAERVVDHLLDPLRIRADRPALGSAQVLAPGLNAEGTKRLFHAARTQEVQADRALHARTALDMEHRGDLATITIARLQTLAAAGVYRGEWDDGEDQRCALCQVQTLQTVQGARP